MSRKNKKPKFRSMRQQIAILFIVIMLATMLVITLLNSVFLKKYYLAKKVEVLQEAMLSLTELDIEELAEDDDGEEILTDGSDKVGRDSSRNNLSWVIVNDDNTWSYNWGENEELLQNKLFGYLYDLDQDKHKGKIIKKTDTYTIQSVDDHFSDMQYLECWGDLDNGYHFLIRTPMASIDESAQISNTFYFFVAMIVMVLSALIIVLYSKRMTKPISELTTLSKDMASLNFDARYTSNAGNEIDVLGENFNRMSEQLEQTVSELKAANIKLQEDIEDKIKTDEMRKEFLDNVSHELKTPIALIQGYAEGLKENINDDPESRDFYVDVIMDEASKMNTLVKSLLTLNQLESGHDNISMERFDIVSVIKGVLQSMEIMIQQNEATVEFDQETPVYVWGDEFKIEEVVTNYVSNALHHLKNEKIVSIKLEDMDSKVKISVFNTGTPIPEKDLPNLWKKFYKVDKARTREYGGSGIGLSIVKAIIEGLNQEYGVQNYENGVEFWFTLDKK